MRRSAALIAILLIGAACSSTKDITGSANVVTTPVAVSAFSTLSVGDAFNVDVSLGAQPALTLEVDDNVMSHVDAGVSNGTLHIGLKPGISVQNATLRAQVTAVGLAAVELSGAAHAHLQDPFGGQSLGVRLSGASGFDGTMQGQAVDAGLSGASELILAGTLQTLKVQASGSSQVNGGKLSVHGLTVDISGASLAIVMVSDTISASVSGASRLQYGGNPTFTRKDVSGDSTIEQI
jgi:putative autotransporter adhesin-like protein